MTMKPHFIQIHTLHNYPAALLNRDDAGLAKRLPMGNAVRTRISSQCLKRHWRKADDHRHGMNTIGVPLADRSRIFFEKLHDTLIEKEVVSSLASVLAEAVRDGLTKDIGKLLKEAKKAKPKSKPKKEKTDSSEDDDTAKRKQAILLGRPEYDYIAKVCLEVAVDSETNDDNGRLRMLERLKAEQDNFQQMKLECGLESALFGRMVTSDILASRDASVYVGHAFTVHEAQVENDYFTVVDDLLQESGELGSAGIFDTELASGLYYGYVVVDVRQLVENLEGIKAQEVFAEGTGEEKRELAANVVEHLLHLIATVSPGAKRGSTAPFDWAKFVLVEAGDWQPRSLASAFQDALPLRHEGEKGLRLRAMESIGQEIGAMDDAYGMVPARRFLALDETSIPQAERTNLEQLGRWVEEVIRQGSC